jgi:SNF2 family DNA or RNA helicase
MVENQAIARVLRLGQKRNVKVVRYIMEKSIEHVSVP